VLDIVCEIAAWMGKVTASSQRGREVERRNDTEGREKQRRAPRGDAPGLSCLPKVCPERRERELDCYRMTFVIEFA